MASDLNNHKRWLKNTSTAVSEAIIDYNYQSKTQNSIYLALDQSILFAPLSLRSKPPIVDNPDDWLDAAADIVFWNLGSIDIEKFGYKLVLPQMTYLTILYNYKIDLDFIESIEQSKDIDDVFFKISAKAAGNSNQSSNVSKNIEEFLKNSDKRHRRLEKLLEYIKNDRILLESFVFDAEGMRRTRTTKEEFDDLYKEINNFRSESNSGSPREMFTKAIEVLSLIDSKKKTDEFRDGRYLFLAWPRARSYYKIPKNYHRTITTLMLKILAMRSDIDVFLVDLRENISYLLRKIGDSVERGRSLSELNTQNIMNIYSEIIGFMDNEMKKIFKYESSPSARGDISNLSLKDVVSAVRFSKARTRKTLDELGKEFKTFETVAGWEELPDDHPIKIVIENIKPLPPQPS